MRVPTSALATFCVVLLAGPAWSKPASQALTATSIQQVPRIAGAFKADTVIFDLDDTLIRPRHALGTQRWFDGLYSGLRGRLGDEKRAFNAAVEVWDLVHQHARMKPVERATARTVGRLKKRHRVLALTARDEKLIGSTLSSLRAMGMPLGKSGPRVGLGRGAYFQDGVIFAGSPENKLYALNAYQRRFGRARRVVFVDDSAKNVESLLSGLHQPIVGVHYTGAERANRGFCAGVARAQLIALERTGRIPSDQRVKLGLKHRRTRR